MDRREPALKDWREKLPHVHQHITIGTYWWEALHNNQGYHWPRLSLLTEVLLSFFLLLSFFFLFFPLKVLDWKYLPKTVGCLQKGLWLDFRETKDDMPELIQRLSMTNIYDHLLRMLLAKQLKYRIMNLKSSFNNLPFTIQLLKKWLKRYIICNFPAL